MGRQFLTESQMIQHIIKSFNITKSLYVSSIIIGKPYTGKKSLVRYLFPTLIFADGNDQKNVEQLLESYDELVIYHFEKLSNVENLDFENKRIIAISDYVTNEKIIDRTFAFIYHMPPLSERPEDVDLLAAYFLKEARSNLMMEKEFPIDYENLDLSANNHSLRRSLYHQSFVQGCDSDDIEAILYQYLFDKMEGNNDYKDYLPLYEKPLIEAGLKKFGSQLKLSEILGINRNTLRKKIYELAIN